MTNTKIHAPSLRARHRQMFFAADYSTVTQGNLKIITKFFHYITSFQRQRKTSKFFLNMKSIGTSMFPTSKLALNDVNVVNMVTN